MKRFGLRCVWTIGAAVLLVCCSSCGSGQRFYPVHGQVLADGKPAEGVTVVLNPVEQPDPAHPLLPSAVVQADGSFDVKTFLLKERVLKDGAPPGNYRITCVWYPHEFQIVPGMELPDKFHGKYANPETSGLQADVADKANTLPPLHLETRKK